MRTRLSKWGFGRHEFWDEGHLVGITWHYGFIKFISGETF